MAAVSSRAPGINAAPASFQLPRKSRSRFAKKPMSQDRQKINRRQRRPRQHQAGNGSQERDGQQFRLPGAPKRFQVGAVESHDPVARIFLFRVAEQRNNPDGFPAEFNLHIGG